MASPAIAQRCAPEFIVMKDPFVRNHFFRKQVDSGLFPNVFCTFMNESSVSHAFNERGGHNMDVG